MACGSLGPQHVNGTVRASQSATGRSGALGLAVLLAVSGLAAEQGGYFPRVWGLASLALICVSAVAVLTLPRVCFSRLEVLALAGLGGLLAWTALSVLWSLDPGQSMLEAQRGLVYLAGLATVLLLADRRSVAVVLAALAIACTLVSAYALARWGLSDASDGAARTASFDATALSTPIGYSSALGLLMAMGSLLVLGFAAHGQSRSTRALAAAALVPLASALSLAGSRAAFVALAGGLAVTVAFGSRRHGVRGAMAAALPAPALAAGLSATGAAATGRALVPALIVLAGSSAALSLGLGIGRDRTRARIVTVAIALLLLFAGPGMASAGAPRDQTAAHPPSPAVNAVDAGRTHGSLTVRLHLWSVAWQSARQRPLLGAGAGSFGRSWSKLRPTHKDARDAHNLYVETLGELGAIGLALLLIVLVAPLIAAARSRHNPLVAAAAGAYAAYLIHAGTHWDWEMPVLTLAALWCGAAILIAQRPSGDARPIGRPARAGALVAALALGAFAFSGLVGSVAMARSRAAAAAGAPGTAVAEARKAARWMPFSGEPWRLAGEAAQAQGRVALARASFRRGLARDPGSWRLWYDLSLVTRGRTQQAAAARSAILNPWGRR
jgi:O-Antigen ligase